MHVFYAFHKAGYKPNAKCFNMVQEDIDHFLKYCTFLHGEWFEGGKRLPGGPAGTARLQLPAGLAEASPIAPDLPNYNRRLDVTDGCPNQYAYGTNFHQTAEWKTKTASWEAARMRSGWQGITRVNVMHVEKHGKGGCDGHSNATTFAIKAAIASGALLDPGTHDLVLYLAAHHPSPSVAKEDKSGWEAATKFFYGYINIAQFTTFAFLMRRRADGQHFFVRIALSHRARGHFTLAVYFIHVTHVCALTSLGAV